jgi:Family of unknown function (DUF6116)
MPRWSPTGMIRDRLLLFASRLRFPKLVALTVALFVLDVLVPDMIPFADELILGLVAVLLAMVKNRPVNR